MKRIHLIGIPMALIIGVLVGRVLLPTHEEWELPAEASPGEEAEIWTCSMHPQIQQSGPGNCPICGMDLIPLVSEAVAEGSARSLSMSEASRALAEIQTTVVERAFPMAEIRLVGKLSFDETREKSLTARFPARIDKLFVNYTGIAVKKGEHLAKVYSPELLTAQRELLTAYRVDPKSSITRAAREKLRLWDLLPEQIDAIIESGEAQDHFVLKAPIGGVVVDRNVSEGDYVETGEPLFKIVDLSVLWANLDAYESDLSWIRFGQDVTFTVESFPGEEFHGQIAFIEPVVNRRTRTVSIRVNVPNPDSRLKPGMFVRGVVFSQMAEGGRVYAPAFAGKWISPMHPEIVKDGPGACDVCGMDLVPAEALGYVEMEKGTAPLVVPSSAVLRTGKRAVVYVEVPDTERPTFEGREIVLGPRAGDSFLVKSGLEAGDRVVTHGAFKIDSALQIQGKPSMMNPSGPADSTVASQHEESDSEMGSRSGGIEIDAVRAADLMPAYLALQAALAGDDLHTAKEQVNAMMKITGHRGDLPDQLHEMMRAEDLETIRRPLFERLSDALIAAAKSNPELMPAPLMVMHCPMVYDDRGANWLQTTEPLQNPYFGAMMLNCGEVVGPVAEGEPLEKTHDH